MKRAQAAPIAKTVNRAVTSTAVNNTVSSRGTSVPGELAPTTSAGPSAATSASSMDNAQEMVRQGRLERQRELRKVRAEKERKEREEKRKRDMEAPIMRYVE